MGTKMYFNLKPFHCRQGSYKLVESDEQWQAMQQQRQQHRSNSRNNNNYGDVSTSSAAMARKSGYMNSGAETEAEMTSHASMKRNKRRQRYILYSSCTLVC
jgi:hypothetical protein